jgi:hypothetical protein
MDVLTLSVIARWQLMQILNDKAKGKPGDRKYGIACDLYDKIFISDEELEKLFHRNPDGTSRPNDQAWREAKKIEVPLNYSELERLTELLKDADLRPLDRQAWAGNLLDQLERLNKPQPDNEEAKTKRLADIRSARQK